MSADVRTRLLRAMRAETNCWMFEFALPAEAVAAALLDGRLTEDIITAYPTYHGPDGTPNDDPYPLDLSRAIADQAGLIFNDGTGAPVYSEHGWRIDVGSEAIGVGGVASLRAIPAADAEIDGGDWSFHEDTLDTHDLTIDQIREVMRGLSLTEAAQLIIDSFDIPIEETR